MLSKSPTSLSSSGDSVRRLQGLGGNMPGVPGRVACQLDGALHTGHVELELLAGALIQGRVKLQGIGRDQGLDLLGFGFG